MITENLLGIWLQLCRFLVNTVVQILPDSPFQAQLFELELPSWAEYIVIFIPIQEIVAFFYVFMSFVVTWFAVRAVLKTSRLIG